MSSAAFKAILAAQAKGEKKDLGKLITGQYLGVGTHEVTIQGVDTSKLEADRLVVSYEDAEGKSYTDRVFVLDYSGDSFSSQLRNLWSALIPDMDAINKLIATAAVNDQAWTVFTGMKCQITLDRGPGFRIKAVTDDSGDKKFVAVDAKTDAELTEYFNEASEAEDAAIAANHRKSYLRVTNVAATNKEANLNAFYPAIEKVAGAAQAGSSAGSGNAGGPKTPPTV